MARSPISLEKRREYNRNYSLKNKEKLQKAALEYRLTKPERALHSQAKHRARKLGLEFNIEIADIVIPFVCPILEIPLFIGEKKATDNSPSLDRKDNNKGYMKDNILVISWKANRLKSNGSIEEIEAVLNYMKTFTLSS